MSPCWNLEPLYGHETYNAAQFLPGNRTLRIFAGDILLHSGAHPLRYRGFYRRISFPVQQYHEPTPSGHPVPRLSARCPTRGSPRLFYEKDCNGIALSTGIHANRKNPPRTDDACNRLSRALDVGPQAVDVHDAPFAEQGVGATDRYGEVHKVRRGNIRKV